MNRVLIVDDDRQLLRALRINLTARHYDVATAADGATALATAARTPPDLAIVDLGLPDLDGVAVIQGLRGWTTIPVIVLSARDAETAKVAALDAGADDYVTKPFGMDELLARIRAALRRTTPTAEAATVTTAAFTIDLAAKRLTTLPATSASPPPNGTCWKSWSATPTNSSPSVTCSARSGTGVRNRNQLPARTPGQPAPQGRTRPGPAPLPHHRTRHRLPLHPLTAEDQDRSGPRRNSRRTETPDTVNRC